MGRQWKREPKLRLPASQGGREQGVSGWVNQRKVLINVVINDKPKDACCFGNIAVEA
jgi:hypothetical protein